MSFSNLKMIRDVKEIEESTLWEETGRQLAARGKADDEDPRKIVVFVLGDKSSGKSSVIKILRNDFDPDTKPNSLIEYWPSKVGLDKKQLLHFYEIGNPELAAFFQHFCTQNTRIYFLICVDLTQASKVITSTSSYLQKIREVCSKRKIEPADQQQRRTAHEDTEVINPLPAYVTLIGSKFDLFEKFDLESKKWINRSLRYVAHTNSCSLMSSSSLQFRSAFADLLSKNELSSKPNFKQFSKPLFALFAEDRIKDMSLPSSGSLSNLEVLEKQLQSIQKPEDKNEGKRDKNIVKGSGKFVQALQKRRNQLMQLIKRGGKTSKDELELV